MSPHNGLVYAVVRQQVLGELPYDEALQAGRTGLWRTILGCDPERGTTFATYAWTAIMRSVWAAIKKWGKREGEMLALSEVEVVVPLPTALPDAVQEPDKRWERKALVAATRQAVCQLPSRLQLVLAARYGWTGNPPATFRQIGEQLGVSPLRPVLSQQSGWQTVRGQIPFDPVSMFLLCGWQTTNKWNRTQMLKNLRDPRYADLATIFGLENVVYPTEGGMRYFLTTLGQNSPDDDNAVVVDEETGEMMARQRLHELIAQSV